MGNSSPPSFIRVVKLKPSPRLSISRDEIRAIYAQGEEAVIELVESLVARINALEERVEALENQRSQNSRNSSKPPSGDGFAKKTKSLRQKSNRSSGGQPGHPGSTLEWSAEPDYIETHPVTVCQGCGVTLADHPVEDWQVRQVHDIPPMPLEVTEHQCEVKSCPRCGTQCRAIPPSSAAVCAVWCQSAKLDGVFDGTAIAADSTGVSIVIGSLWH
jgi:transposase